MGGGGQHADEVRQQPASPSPRSVRHRRRTHELPVDVDSGLDSPPSVTLPSLGNRPCNLSVRTSQHLCTLVHPQCNSDSSEEAIPAGVSPCDPLIAFGRFVVSATDDGRVCLFSIQCDQGLCRPIATVEIDANSTLTGLAATPKDTCLVRYYHRSTLDKERLLTPPPDFLGHLVAITSEGDVHIIECSNHGPEIVAKKLFSWNTGTCNASCLTARPDRNGQWRISLGYESGILEEWQVSIPVKQPTAGSESLGNGNDKVIVKETNDKTDASANQNMWMPLMRKAVPKLLFRGYFDLPIRSVASLGFDQTGKDESNVCFLEGEEPSRYRQDEVDILEATTKKAASEAAIGEETNRDARTIVLSEGATVSDNATPEPEDKLDTEVILTEKYDRRDYLSLCLAVHPRTSDESIGRPASSSQIEVVHISWLEQEWAARQEEAKEDGGAIPSTGVSTFALEGYCVWPSVGMEILDTTSLPVNERRLSLRIRGLPSQGSDRMCTYYGTNPFFAASLSDGTIARMSATCEDERLRWGVSSDFDQYTLSYPAIGIASVDLGAGRNHIACSLRGGTVYLLPQDVDLEPVVVILGPIVEQDGSTQYLQGFAAGNVCVDGMNSANNNYLPVLIYSSSDGVLKVHTCQLLSTREHDSLLRELVDNGTVQLLREFLCSLPDDDPQLSPNVWKKSRDELVSSGDGTLTFETVSTSSFVNTRHVLMALSQSSSVIP